MHFEILVEDRSGKRMLAAQHKNAIRAGGV